MIMDSETKIKNIPVLLLTGYLGSGKTTLVNHILTNKKGIKFAVIVNDIGEVNIDAELIKRNGVIDMNDDSLVALENGCICCTLRTDLIEQIFEILKSRKFDYIVIEASGICEPESIANTICSIPQLGGAYTQYGISKLDTIVTVVDALRMRDEFCCAESLTRNDLATDDIENLLIHQIEFSNIVLLNKSSEVSKEELDTIKKIVVTLQPQAEIIECNYADIDIERILNTSRFRYDYVAASAGWVQELGKHVTEEDTDRLCCSKHDHDECNCHNQEDDCGHNHEHKHCNDHRHCNEHDHDNEHDHEHNHECACGHHHHSEECHCNHGGETEEYGIGTLLYFRRAPFDMNKFDYFITSQWPKNIIRAKGVCYFNDDTSMSYLFEQAGKQKQLSEAGLWYATLPEADIERLKEKEPGLLRDWDEKYGDRMQKIVFIGKGIDKEKLIRELDMCLDKSF